MNLPDPVVRYLIVCEDVLSHPAHPLRVSLINLVNSIRPAAGIAFPIVFPELCVFLELIECRGPARCQIEISHADSGQATARTQDRHVALPTDPLALHGLVFRIRHCPFPEPGLYWVRFQYNDTTLAQQAIVVRAGEDPDAGAGPDRA